MPIDLLVAGGVDLLLDGILVGLSIATLGRTQGVTLTIALTLVILPLALSVTVELARRGVGAARAALVPLLLSLALVSGAIAAVLLLGSAPAALLAAILGFGMAALLFPATEAQLGEAHETVHTPLLAAMFFVGFFAVYVLDARHCCDLRATEFEVDTPVSNESVGAPSTLTIGEQSYDTYHRGAINDPASPPDLHQHPARNQFVSGTEGGLTRHPSYGPTMSIVDATTRWAADDVPSIMLPGAENESIAPT